MRLLRAAPCVVVLLAPILLLGCAGPDSRPEVERAAGVAGGIPPGTSAPEVAITSDGVPHIRAQDLEGAYFGLGWVTARDRAGQLELFRRAAEGRASEILGNRALESDGFLLSLDIMGRARAIMADAAGAPFARRALAAYAAGVNARFDSLRAGLVPLPRDLAVAGVRPGRWTPEHSVAVGLLQGLRQDGEFPQLDFAELAEERGEDAARASWAREPLVEYWTVEDSLARDPGPELPIGAEAAAAPGAPATRLAGRPGAALVTAGAGAGRAAARASAFLASALPPGGPGASNAWAVGGARTRRGAPLLANDAHLGLATPSPFYAVHVVIPDSLDVIGLQVPGLPFFSSGRNADLAWGVTALGAMAFEVYRESLDVSGKQALFQGKWEPIRSRPLGLRYRLGPLELPLFWVRARHTRHGVVAEMDRKRRRAYTVRWAAIEPWPAVTGDFGWERARTLEEFRSHLGGVFAPTLNWVVAEKGGRVLYQTAGWVPRRGYPPSLEPTPGFDGRYEWAAPLPSDSMPHVTRGPDGVIVNCNNGPAGPDAFSPVGVYTASAWRARRVRALLGERRDLIAADMQMLQADALSPQWPVFGPLMLARAHGDADTTARRRQMLAVLSGWSGDAVPGQLAATVFRAWWSELNTSLETPGREGLLLAVLRGEVPPPEERAKGSARARASRPAAGPEKEGSGVSAGTDRFVARGLTRALERLEDKLGRDLRAWDWARAHRAVFRHVLAGKDRTLTPRSVAARGDRAAVCVGTSRLPRDTLVTHGPVMRVVFDLADSSGWFVLPPGNSGDPASPHYDDMLEAWAEVRYRSFDLAWPAPERIESGGRLVIPGQAAVRATRSGRAGP